MAGKHHTGRRGPSVALSRDLQGVLEARTVATADLRQAVYVRSDGPGWAIVRNRDNGQEYRVSDSTGRTYRPGAAVILGSASGSPGETILGGAPAGYGGSSSYAPSDTVRTAPPRATHVAFFSTGSVVAASYYAEVEPATTLGEAPEAGDEGGGLNSATFIRRDSRGFVGDYSLAYFVEGEDRISCFDPSAGVVHSYSPSDAYHVSGVGYASGYLWWCEGEDAQHGTIGTYATTFRLCRANCDLTDVTTVSTFDFANDNGEDLHMSFDWTQGFSAHIPMVAGLVVEAPWGQAGSDISGALRITWGFGGGESHESEQSFGDPLPTSDVPAETVMAVNDHPDYGSPLFGGAFRLTS